ncbi:MAG: beta-lactamase family protein [Alphaproteobacteria bacterium]|nr:beta-lactamase family protein [Alphaproteobacteria bacterium]
MVEKTPDRRGLRLLRSFRPDRSPRLGALIPRSQGPLVPRSVVDVFPVREVRRKGPEAPSELDVGAIWREVERVYKTGLHPAIALNVVHRGQCILDRTIGHLDNQPGGPTGAIVTPDSLFNLFSASKIVTSTLVQALVDDGVLDLDQRVVHWLPEFASHGKQGIRLHHLLQHTAGLPAMPRDFDLDAALDLGRMPMAPLFDLVPVTPPGHRVAYSPLAGFFLVQEIIERATGRELRGLLRERLLDPLGIATLDYGVPPERVGDVALHAVTGPPAPAIMADIFARTAGVDLDTAVRLTNDPRFLTAVLPSANVIGTPRDVGRFLQMLLQGGELDGQRVIRPDAVQRMTTRVTGRQFDGTFGFPMRYGLGVMMGGTAFSLFGLDTPGAYGHLGLSNVVVFADPARDLAVTYLTTGKPMMDVGMVRWFWVLQRIAAMVPRS